MKFVDKKDAEIQAKVVFTQRGRFGDPIRRQKTLYFSELPKSNYYICHIDLGKIRDTAIHVVRNQQSNIETFKLISVTLKLKNPRGDFFPAY